MKFVPFFCLLLGCCLAAPSDPKPTDTDIVVVTDEFLKNDYIVYTAEHDIVKIYAPLNQFPLKEYNLWGSELNFPSDSEEDKPCPKYTVFFVEADINNNEKTYKGLYVRRNDQVTKLLDNGRDAVANNENEVYFGATDGIYKYNSTSNTAEKHGAVTDNIIQLAFNNVTNTIYYVTANHEVYKLNSEATSSVKVSAAKDVQTVVFGYDGRMYYYDSKKDVYVFDEGEKYCDDSKEDATVLDDTSRVKAPVKITDLPASADKIVLISPLIGMEEGAVLLVDKIAYLIKPDGTSRQARISLDLEATAYEPKPTLIQFLAKDKKLYELDVGAVLQSNTDKLPATLPHLIDALPILSDCKKKSV